MGPRSTNQDAAFTASWGAAVADGVGGGPAGDLASAVIVHRLAAGRLSVADDDALVRAVRGANWDLWAHTQRDPSLLGMATTLTGLAITTHDKVLLVHSGDSRAYRVRNGRLSLQTRDDSLVQALVDSGMIAPHEASTHPRRNIVTASLGGGLDDGLSVWPADAAAGDRWLLCSDGVSDYLPADAIVEALVGGGVQQAAAAVVASALDAGTRDNVTAVVCDLVSDAGLDTRTETRTQRESASFFGSAAARFAERLEDAS